MFFAIGLNGGRGDHDGKRRLCGDFRDVNRRRQWAGFIQIIEFDSYESAMENSEQPKTQEFSTAMAKLCDGPPKFYNLDVYRIME